MGFFQTREEKERLRELERRVRELDRFPGSLDEYSSLKGQEYMIMDIGGRPRKFVDVDNKRETSFIRILIEQGCTGFIRYAPVSGTNRAPGGGYGIPVKSK